MRASRHQSDDRLLAQARAGRADAFEAFYRRHVGLLLAVARRNGAAPETAADVAAETFAALLELVHGERELPHTPASWIAAVAQRKVIDAHRRGRVESAARDRLGIVTPAFSADDAELVDTMVADVDLERSLAQQLPADQFTAVRARVLDGRPYPEIASELGVTEAVARKRVSRALMAIRAQMEPSER